MTVGELIKILQTYPPDTKVASYIGYNEYVRMTPASICSVKLKPKEDATGVLHRATENEPHLKFITL